MAGALALRAEELVARLEQRGLLIATAESCTAGRLAALLADAPGASAVLDGGFITYTKQAKQVLLGVPEESLSTPGGAVTPDVARAMAAGALSRSNATLAVALTGVLGPACDEDDNPVGRLDIACAWEGGTRHRRHELGEAEHDRLTEKALDAALTLLDETLDTMAASRGR
ncbi:hypothetical protein ASG72_01525 [Bosea sp. Leaf344]|uniref:CinA family protein n=1 Tax=Bosea sp. Leaf344 TaxID=1736346 RepID=UPI0006FAFA8A|nr:CinA family protein [Bosea sp. Leaf344]KQU54354.1 hypothetical protein ASG72_01525 [Bosea sp. Leaf344]